MMVLRRPAKPGRASYRATMHRLLHLSSRELTCTLTLILARDLYGGNADCPSRNDEAEVVRKVAAESRGPPSRASVASAREIKNGSTLRSRSFYYISKGLTGSNRFDL